MRPSLTTLTLIPLGLVVGCTETPTAAPDAVRRVPSHQAVLAALSTLHTDTTDTWFSADLAFSPSMSVGLPEPGYNPATGSIGLSAESPTATIQLHVEGGYLATGETLLHVQILNDGVSDPVPTDPVAFRFVNDVPTLFDRTGAVLAMNADDYAAAQDIIDDIGSFRDLVFDVTGGAGDSSGTGGTFFARDKSDSVDVESTETRGTDRHLKAIRHVVSRRRGPSRISTGFEVTLRNVRSHTNSARDAARRERRAAEDARRVTGTRDTDECPEMEQRSGFERTSCYEGGPSSPAPSVPGCDTFRSYVADSTSSANVVFQHGIWSDACTWAVARPYLHDQLALGMAVESRTGHSEGYWAQQSQLRSGLDAARGARGQFVFVGHSQGGVVSRLAAQQVGPDLVRGVVTLDSPNQGALIAEPWRASSAAAVINAIPEAITPPVVVRFLNRILPDPIRSLRVTLGRALVVAPLIGAVRCSPSNEAACDARPGSGILQQVNSASSTFPTISIVGLARHDLILWRLVGDQFDSRTLGGRRTVHRLRTYRLLGLGVGGVLSAFGVTRSWGNYLLQLTGVIIASDLLWRGIYAGGSGGDGFIHAEGQPVYGANTERIFVQDADAHTAAQFGMDRGVRALRRALEVNLSVPLRTPQ